MKKRGKKEKEKGEKNGRKETILFPDLPWSHQFDHARRGVQERRGYDCI
jgi:hypothetical protein